jgi:hypothetical protein
LLDLSNPVLSASLAAVVPWENAFEESVKIKKKNGLVRGHNLWKLPK